MEHMQYLVVRSHNSDEQAFHHPAENPDDREYEHMSGHAMMATCPPFKHVQETPNEPYPFKMPELPTPDLTKLLDLSARLPLNHDSEITPIMAWTQIYRDSNIAQLSAQDFERLKIDLGTKVRCYGYVTESQIFCNYILTIPPDSALFSKNLRSAMRWRACWQKELCRRLLKPNLRRRRSRQHRDGGTRSWNIIRFRRVGKGNATNTRSMSDLL